MTPDEALDRLRALDDKHFPTTRAKRPGWEVCDHDSMTWPCDTQKALDAVEVLWPLRSQPASEPSLDVERLANAIEVQEAGSTHPAPLLTAWSDSGQYWLTSREVAERIATEYRRLSQPTEPSETDQE